MLDYPSLGADGVAPTALQGLNAFFHPGRRTRLRHGPMAWAGITPHLRCWVALVPTVAAFRRLFGLRARCRGRNSLRFRVNFPFSADSLVVPQKDHFHSGL